MFEFRDDFKDIVDEISYYCEYYKYVVDNLILYRNKISNKTRDVCINNVVSHLELDDLDDLMNCIKLVLIHDLLYRTLEILLYNDTIKKLTDTETNRIFEYTKNTQRYFANMTEHLFYYYGRWYGDKEEWYKDPYKYKVNFELYRDTERFVRIICYEYNHHISNQLVTISNAIVKLRAMIETRETQIAELFTIFCGLFQYYNEYTMYDEHLHIIVYFDERPQDRPNRMPCDIFELGKLIADTDNKVTKLFDVIDKIEELNEDEITELASKMDEKIQFSDKLQKENSNV